MRDALATTYLTWSRIDEREGTEVYARRVMLTAHAGQTGVPPVAPGPAPGGDQHEQIWSALRALTPRERAVLVLGVRDRLDDDEIARVLDCGRKAVQTDAAHALTTVRQALVAGRAAASNPIGDDEPVPPVLSLTSLESAIRETLAAHADDVGPPASLVDDAWSRADVLRHQRRNRRLTAAAVSVGLVTVVAVGAALVGGRDPGGARPAGSSTPTPASSPSSSAPRPSSSVVAVPDTVLRLARDNNALVAYGSAIIDAAKGSTLVNIDADPATGASRGPEILALARASAGYIVLTRSQGVGVEGTPRVLSYVRSDGSRVELGRTTVDASGFAVSPDGRYVVHVIQGPTQGENAIGPGQSELVVQTLGADVMNRIAVVGLVAPVSLTDSTVVFRRIDDRAGPSYVWHRVTGLIEPLALAPAEVSVQVASDRALLHGGARRDCVAVSVIVVPSRPDQLWRRCGVFATARFDPTGSVVAVVTTPEATAELRLLDARTGRIQDGLPVKGGFPFQLEWSANASTILVASVGAQGQVTYTAVAHPRRGGVLVVGSYEVAQGPVVLGEELPLTGG